VCFAAGTLGRHSPLTVEKRSILNVRIESAMRRRRSRAQHMSYRRVVLS